MVGRSYEEEGIIRNGAKLINAFRTRPCGHHDHGGRLIWRRQLCHVRTRLRAAFPVYLAQPSIAVMGEKQLSGVMTSSNATLRQDRQPVDEARMAMGRKMLEDQIAKRIRLLLRHRAPLG